ncbi:MAG: mandelate racemase/muconate lactonizing enzyme family protein [Propionibacteriaceae bacterium]|nr:mandelate racemase/muconate lactonizing enzyme family protein [Propionibacteriaceae bacterium]
MSKIIGASAFLADIEVETLRTDAMQSFIKQETIFVDIVTDDGLRGRGYSYTIGTGGKAVLAMLNEHFVNLLVGEDSRDVERLWRKVYDSSRATSVGVITALAIASIDTALWDLRSKRNGEPLWKTAGGMSSRVPLYDTEGGWLHLSAEDLVAGALDSKARGLRGAKIKVGKPSAAEDADRIGAVRAAVGSEFDIMVDANQAFTAAEAIRRAAAFAPHDLAWFEEPLPAEDVDGHVRLARSTSIPIAVGESMYSLGHFREYLQRGAAGIVQVDVARIGGITPWLKTAHMAEAFNTAVCPHFLMELHVSLAAAVPNGAYVEHIPQLRAVTQSSFEICDGWAIAPVMPGLGIDWDDDAIDARRVV